jgi:transposase
VSVPKPERQRTIFDVSFQVERLFGPRSRYRLFREKVMPVLWKARPEVAELYCAENGRPATEPVLMMGVTLLQFLEGLADRAAVDHMRLHLGWKYALDLELDDEGIHPTSLVKFRNRLVEGGKERVVFDAVLEVLRAEGLVRRRARQRLDSTHVLGAVAEMSQMEVVRETIRLVLEAWMRGGLSDRVPNWEQLAERYVESTVNWSRQNRTDRRKKLLQGGQDARALIAWARLQDPAVWSSDQMLLLERVFLEQFELAGAEAQPQRPLPSQRVQNPHDPEAQWSTKETMRRGWVGYKMQLAETVADDGEPKPKGEPTEQFVTDMLTTPATASDPEGMARMQAAQRERDEELPPELLVDSGYVSGQALAEARDEGRELIGPARPAQASKNIFTAEAFDVDVANQRARCPAGKTSCSCLRVYDHKRGCWGYRFGWGEQCDTCPLQSQCTTKQSGRRMLNVGEHHDLVQARRRAMKTEDFKAKMRQRAGVEGTLSELKRNGLERTRYRGLRKTGLAHFLLGAACNVRRWLRRLAWELAQAPAPS